MENPELKNLDSLFEQLAEGEMPNFLEMMAALSDVSTIWPTAESVCDGEFCLNCE